jgi:D-alanyl-D-alanine carboxypeptidase (penicillin-binding protein 5/6)
MVVGHTRTRSSLRRSFVCIATLLCLVAGGSTTAAAAPVSGISQPSGSLPIPDGPAQAWIVADLDSGAVLAARDEYGRYAPASTIKVLLALTVLDELPLDTTIVATEADTKVECNCAGVAPGHVYTARQLLEALLLVSGNDAANTLATMLGGLESAAMKMNAKAALLGAYGTNVGSPSGPDGPGIDMWSAPHDLAVIFRAAIANPVFAQITAEPSMVSPPRPGTRCWSTRTSCCSGIPVPSAARMASPTSPARRSSAPRCATAAGWSLR